MGYGKKCTGIRKRKGSSMDFYASLFEFLSLFL
jgi:hypothetical protein